MEDLPRWRVCWPLTAVQRLAYDYDQAALPQRARAGPQWISWAGCRAACHGFHTARSCTWWQGRQRTLNTVDAASPAIAEARIQQGHLAGLLPAPAVVVRSYIVVLIGVAGRARRGPSQPAAPAGTDSVAWSQPDLCPDLHCCLDPHRLTGPMGNVYVVDGHTQCRCPPARLSGE